MRDDGIIDWEQYGLLLKAARLRAGYPSGQALCHALFDRTGLSISGRTIYMLESAQRTPTADVFLAIQLTLPDMANPEYIRPAFKNQGIRIAVVDL